MSLDIGKVAIALLGLLAYKNRDKIGELIAGRKSTDPNASAGSPGGLGDILDRLRNAGAGDQVNSWVSRGSNRPVRPEQVEKAIDPQMLDDLAEQTGVRIARATFTRLREQGIIIRSTSDLTSNTFVINSAPVTPQVEEVLQAS